jgi:hypothetical protein
VADRVLVGRIEGDLFTEVEVDGADVVIGFGRHGLYGHVGSRTLSLDEQEHFSQLWVAACLEAEANAKAAGGG